MKIVQDFLHKLLRRSSEGCTPIPLFLVNMDGSLHHLVVEPELDPHDLQRETNKLLQISGCYCNSRRNFSGTHS